MSESTPLRSDAPAPDYLFVSWRQRHYRNRVRHLQCCICATIMCIFIIALTATVSYMVNHDMQDEKNSSVTPEGNQTLVVLLTLQWPRAETPHPPWPEPIPNITEIQEALVLGVEKLHAKEALERTLRAKGLTTKQGSSASYHQAATGTAPETIRFCRAGYVLDYASRHLRQSKKYEKNATGHGPDVKQGWLPPGMCGKSHLEACNKTKYRTENGTCNNLRHPMWGSAMAPYRRSMPADYDDGISAPRGGYRGNYLPSARQVSVLIHPPLYRADPKYTLMAAAWGQFVDHDITATALSKGVNDSGIVCCSDEVIGNSSLVHPECFPISVKNDKFYKKFNVSCMELVRSAPAPTCEIGPREQLNQITSFLDGSVIYGSSWSQTQELRVLKYGQLRMQIADDGRTLLPFSTDPQDGCNLESEIQRSRYCFRSGDSRVNENLGLTSLTLIWARHHNRIADELKDLNPRWDDERLFQEARRIVAAQIQHVTYNEFLPVLLGEELMDHLHLRPQASEYFDGYDESVNPTMSNEFAAAAFRFGHSMIQGLVKMVGVDGRNEDYIQLHKLLFNPYRLYDVGHMDNLLRGFSNLEAHRADTFFTKQLSEQLFRPRNGSYGLDLVAINIQRGRDHGLASYPAWREFCGFSRPRNFSDLKNHVDEKTRERLSEIYKSIDDVDLYSGALSEYPIEGGILGPTLACLIADQFLRLKVGDRFWYENSLNPQAFSLDQLDEIRKTTLARIICDNSDTIEASQLWVMRKVGPDNVRASCNNELIPRLDLGPWEENPDDLDYPDPEDPEGEVFHGPRGGPGEVGRIKFINFATDVRVMPSKNYSKDGNHSSFAKGSDGIKASNGMFFLNGTVVAGSVIISEKANPHYSEDFSWNGSFPTIFPFPEDSNPLPKSRHKVGKIRKWLNIVGKLTSLEYKNSSYVWLNGTFIKLSKSQNYKFVDVDTNNSFGCLLHFNRSEDLNHFALNNTRFLSEVFLQETSNTSDDFKTDYTSLYQNFHKSSGLNKNKSIEQINKVTSGSSDGSSNSINKSVPNVNTLLLVLKGKLSNETLDFMWNGKLTVVTTLPIFNNERLVPTIGTPSHDTFGTS